MTVPILQPGDKVHLVIPPGRTPEETRRIGNELIDLYRVQWGVEITVVTDVHGVATKPEVIAILREPKPSLRKRPDGLWEEI